MSFPYRRPVYARRRFRASGLFVAGLILFVIGIPFCCVGAFMVYDSQSFLQGIVSTKGVIVSCAQSDSQGDDSSDSCQPTIRFQIATGQLRIFTSSFGSSSYHKDQTIPVNYHPNNPSDVRISDFIALWLLPLIFGGIGLFIVILGALFVLVPLLLMLLLGRQEGIRQG